MQYTYFRIQNFKGIEDLTLSFDAKPDAQVITLVGLNESGKTTILEAINSFRHKPESLEALELAGYRIDDPHDMMPISKRTNFSDRVSLTAGVALSDADEEDLQALLSDLNISFGKKLHSFSISNRYIFNDSRYSSLENYLDGIPNYSKGKSKTLRKVDFSSPEGLKIQIWLLSRLPSIIYFPNFLFNFPDRIYLESAPSEQGKHVFYRGLVQRMLDATEPGLDLQKHIIDRATSGDKNAERALKSVTMKLQANVTKTVFDAWDNVFRKKQSGKEVVLNVERDEDGRLYLEVGIKDGASLFTVGERSLGFRWFFAFLLLTHYTNRDPSTTRGQLFLLDEPASNLHSAAQAQLMESFARFPVGSRVMYTTHSHHMINTKWLESAYVVKNGGMSYDGSDSDYSSRSSKIVIERYRKFSITHPDQTTYYQPILDVLEYKPSNLELPRDAVFLEGKNDSYSLLLGSMQAGVNLAKTAFVPGTGSGNMECLIRLYLGWGRKFVILLDDDKAGISEKRRYEGLFGVGVGERIFTLADVDPKLKGTRLEDVVPEDERIRIQQYCYPASVAKFDKVTYNRSIQELLATSQLSVLSSSTASILANIAKFCLHALSTQN